MPLAQLVRPHLRVPFVRGTVDLLRWLHDRPFVGLSHARTLREILKRAISTNSKNCLPCELPRPTAIFAAPDIWAGNQPEERKERNIVLI